MADAERMSLTVSLRKAKAEPQVDVLQEGVRVLAEAVMDLEMEQQLGAGWHGRTPSLSRQRNGYRERIWDTRVGTVPLRVLRVRDGSYFPSLLEPRTRGEIHAIYTLDGTLNRSSVVSAV
jgi:putative transposase